MICEDCKNSTICKHTGEASKLSEQAKQLEPSSILSPFKVKFECTRFEKKAQRQDGIWNNGK